MKYYTPLPFVLSKEDALFFIDSIPNLKKKAFVALLYSSGLRVSEVCHLRFEDISREDKRIFIRRSKNRADRYAQLSPFALDILTDYWRTHGRPRGWLFPGQKPDSCITKATASLYVKEHVERLGWTHPITTHTFRHYGERYEMVSDDRSLAKLLTYLSVHSPFSHCLLRELR